MQCVCSGWLITWLLCSLCWWGSLLLWGNLSNFAGCHLNCYWWYLQRFWILWTNLCSRILNSAAAFLLFSFYFLSFPSLYCPLKAVRISQTDIGVWDFLTPQCATLRQLPLPLSVIASHLPVGLNRKKILEFGNIPKRLSSSILVNPVAHSCHLGWPSSVIPCDKFTLFSP